MSQGPITQSQWGQVMHDNPSKFQGNRADRDRRPVEQVSWHNAMEFCARLGERTGRIYTLPSEAQWEYACRAGTTTPFHCGNIVISELANFDPTFAYKERKGDYRAQTSPVGQFPANSWGVCDCHGNVIEWCLDHWHDSYEGAPDDGSAWVMSQSERSHNEEEQRVLRGGSWCFREDYCRSALRGHYLPDNANSSIGFRVVCLPGLGHLDL